MARVTITVDDDHLDGLEEVAGALRAQGMEVAQVLGIMGLITGSVPDDRRETLAAVEGVASVHDELTHQLPPPDAPIQ